MSCYYRKYNDKTDNIEIIEEKVFDPGKTY